MFRKVILYFCTVVLVFTSFGATTYAETDNFSDISDSAWYYDAVMTLAEKGIVTGYADGSFKPLEHVHRDAFSTMMVKTLDLPIESPSGPWFTDVPKSNWAYAYVETAKYYMTGYKKGDGYAFKPTENAVREDMAVALVKALDYETEGNLSYLDKFSDADAISDNLKSYVATAVKHGLMSGSPSDAGYAFNPQADLTRAETAALLMNILKQTPVEESEEKVTFDAMMGDDQTTGTTETSTPVSDTTGRIPAVNLVTEADAIYVEWSKVNASGFSGYKVVASQSDTSPVYPENGYYKYITDIDTTSVRIKPYASYNGGDVGTFEPGTRYHISVTALYDDEKYAGNTQTAVMPGEAMETVDYITPAVSVQSKGDHLELTWNEIDHPKLQGYKVVASKSDSSPAYPENGYFKWITDTSVTSCLIYPGKSYNSGDIGSFESGTDYYFSITAVYTDKKVAGNVKYITLP